MVDRVSADTELLEWAVASRALPGETASGDQALVRRAGSAVLACVVDALGHGAEAAASASRALAVVDRFAHEPLPSIVQRCHADLIGSRGVVMSLASFQLHDHSLGWLGIGNVEGVLLAADPRAMPSRTSLITRGGIVGSDLPRVTPWTVPLHPGDILVFSTDGIRPGYPTTLLGGEPVQHLADRILATGARSTDDALVLVIRYLGEQ